jgi:hypothetical protein
VVILRPTVHCLGIIWDATHSPEEEVSPFPCAACKPLAIELNCASHMQRVSGEQAPKPAYYAFQHLRKSRRLLRPSDGVESIMRPFHGCVHLVAPPQELLKLLPVEGSDSIDDSDRAPSSCPRLRSSHSAVIGSLSKPNFGKLVKAQVAF